MAQVSIDRTSLGKAPLVIRGDGSKPYSLTQAGLGRPAVTARTSSVSSPWLHGETVTQVVREQSSLALEVLLQADTPLALDQAADDLDEALWQFSYSLTVTVGSENITWLCSPASYGLADGTVLSDNVDQHYEVWTVTVPVYPIPTRS